MNTQLDQLIRRWKEAFAQQAQIAQHKAQVVVTRYADGSRFNLEKFEPSNFPAGGSMQDSKDGINPISLMEYGFNEAGRPCYVSYHHAYNKLHWEGYYSYKDTVIEFVKFCVTFGVPTTVQRLTYGNGRKTRWESFAVNGMGPGFDTGQMEAYKNQLPTNINAFIATINNYHYDSDGRLVKTSGMQNMPGLEQYDISDKYSYNEHGQLDTIRRSYGSQLPSQLIYCHIPAGTSAGSVMDVLADTMAAAIVETMLKAKPEQPMALLNLAYQYPGGYLPLLCCSSARWLAKQLEEKQTPILMDTGGSYDFTLDTDAFERLFAQFGGLMEQHNDPDMGRMLLYKVASLLNANKLCGKLAVTDDFGVYATDWSIDGHSYVEVIQIFHQCGIAAHTLESWRQKGVFHFWPDAS